MSHHRSVTADHVNFYIESIAGSVLLLLSENQFWLVKKNYRTRTAQVRHTESSMRNGFGLKLLHKFFNLPFLQLQKESLQRQIERNERETNTTIEVCLILFNRI